ncbi:hypothetical protein FRB93_003479 [Tulasnella sp. JGI-2019a]|nr:hypothetical protein FRB93_003479 [Tulasnella sp. JGI-2019a]
MTSVEEEKSLLDKLDAIAPIREFDAFPKVARTYYTQTSLGGLATALVIILSFFLSLNDIGEFLWGWPDIEYSVDNRLMATMNINLDMVVNMPCETLSIDIRDAIGDRLHLTTTFARDGTSFDARQAHTLHSHGNHKSTQEIVTSARKKSGGLFAAFKSQSSSFKPTYSHYPSNDACRIYGSVEVKRVTGNLHITSLGHGYVSHQHVDHKLINFTHVISELSFGPYFPNIAQPLDYTYEVTDEHFSVMQYYVTVVPTVYHAPRSAPLRTNQYSVNSYRRTIEHGRGTPGIFIKFDVDPMEMNVWQRTTSFPQFFIRLCGVIGGVWVCAGWAVKIFARAATITGVVGQDDDTIVNDAENARLRKKASARWGGSDIRARTGGGSGWTIDGGALGTPITPYTPSSAATQGAYPSGYLNTPNGLSPNPMSHANGFAPANVPLPVTPLPATPNTPAYQYANGHSQAAQKPTSSQLGNGYSSGPSTPLRADTSQTPPPKLSPSPYSTSANGSSASLRPRSGLNPAATDKRLD